MMNEDPFAIASQLYDDAQYKEAFEQFLLLAKHGDSAAMTRVAAMYGEGKGVEYDFQECVGWDMKAADAGSQAALFNLGISYRNIGDVRVARRWFEKSLQVGDGEAALELAKMYLISELETERVKKYLEQALQSKNICEASREESERLLNELLGLA
jgi:uncharacterized protein